MKKIFLLAALIIPLLAVAQVEQKSGITFEQNLSWDQLKEKARAENKYIFIDVFATWCGPCKMMDQQVYPNDTVGSFTNDKFISVKVQMDSSKKDNDQVKSWYADAKKINEQYHIEGYPSFLFFAPNGKLIFRGLGYQNVKDFIALAKSASDPETLTLYSQMQNYADGKKNYAELPKLIKFTDEVVSQHALAKKMAADYCENYLDTVSEDKLLTKENFFLVTNYDVINSNDRLFHLFYSEPENIDSIVQGPGWAKYVVGGVVTKEELRGKLIRNGKAIFRFPDWDKLRFNIQAEYPKINAHSLVFNYQIEYYRQLKDWKNWSYYKNIEIHQHVPKDLFHDIYMPWNVGGAWDAFLNCNSRNVLTMALTWINKALSDPLSKPVKDNIASIGDMCDTKAALLYKLGHTKEAIFFEKKAIFFETEWAKENGKDIATGEVPSFEVVIQKMKKAEPTYLDQGAIWDANTLPKKTQRL